MKSHVALPLGKLRGVAEDAAVVLVALLGHHVDAQQRHPRVLAVPGALRPPVVPALHHAREVGRRLHLDRHQPRAARRRHGRREHLRQTSPAAPDGGGQRLVGEQGALLPLIKLGMRRLRGKTNEVEDVERSRFTLCHKLVN